MRIIIAIFLSLVYSLVQAQQAENVQRGKLTVICAEWPEIGKMLGNYGERPFLRAISNRFEESGNSTNRMIIFTNPASHSYSIVEQWADDLYCVISVGQYLEPYVD